MTNRELHNYELSIDTKINDFGQTAVRSNFVGISRDFAILRGNSG